MQKGNKELGEKDPLVAKSESKEKITIDINRDWCKGCGICVSFCPEGVLGLENEKSVVLHPEKCIACGMCELRCPDMAIEVKKEEV